MVPDDGSDDSQVRAKNGLEGRRGGLEGERSFQSTFILSVVHDIWTQKQAEGLYRLSI